MKAKTLTFLIFLSFFGIALTPSSASADQLGASLYIMPPSDSLERGNNFTLYIKVDSLGEPVNAVDGVLSYNKDKVEIISVSKIGSIFNLWVQEPQYSNLDGTLKFSGGVPKPGFIGNGGVVLLVIFKAKASGDVSLIWKSGNVLAADGKGTNILTNLQNLNFEIAEKSAVNQSSNNQPSILGTGNIYLLILIVLGAIFVLFVINYFITNFAIKYHDMKFHHRDYDPEPREPQEKTNEDNPPSS